MSSAIEGLLGSVLGQLGGGNALGGNAMGGIIGKVAPALIGMLASGGMAKLMHGFQANGLGDHAASWVGTGENTPVTSDQVTQALGADQVSQFAAQAGIPEDQAGEVLARALPAAIDHVTPGGELPADDDLDAALNA